MLSSIASKGKKGAPLKKNPTNQKIEGKGKGKSGKAKDSNADRRSSVIGEEKNEEEDEANKKPLCLLSEAELDEDIPARILSCKNPQKVDVQMSYSYIKNGFIKEENVRFFLLIIRRVKQLCILSMMAIRY